MTVGNKLTLSSTPLLPNL